MDIKQSHKHVKVQLYQLFKKKKKEGAACGAVEWVMGVRLRCRETGSPGEGKLELGSSCLQAEWLHSGELGLNPRNKGNSYSVLCV